MPPTFVVNSIDGRKRRPATSGQNRPPSGVWGRLVLGQPSNRMPQSGSSGARPQPFYHHLARRSPAAWQAVPLDHGLCEGQCLLAGLPLLPRKWHPLANDVTSYFRPGHCNFLSMSRLFRRRAIPPFGPDRSAIAAPIGHNRIHAGCPARQQSRASPPQPEPLTRCRFLSVTPDHQHGIRAEEIHPPVQRRLKLVKRAAAPIHQRNIVLTSCTAAVASRGRQQIPEPVQLQHQFHALEPATTMRCRVEQPASAIIGSIILSPAAT